MRHFVFKIGADEFCEIAGQPIFEGKSKNGKLCLPETGPGSVETVFRLAETEAMSGGNFRELSEPMKHIIDIFGV